MKKVLALLLTLVLTFAAFSTNVFAVVSPEQLEGIITDADVKDANGKEWEIVVKKASGTVDPFKNAAEGNDIVDHKELVLIGEGDPKMPITVKFVANGIKATDKGFILFKGNDGKISKIAATMENGFITAEFPSLGEFVLVLQKEGTDSTEPPKSDQTSDNLTPAMFALLLASAAVAIISVKKLKNVA